MSFAWAKMPSRWIKEGGLAAFQWSDGKGDMTAALLLFMALCVERNRANVRRSDRSNAGAAPDAAEDVELVRATYDRLVDVTALSRAKVAKGLQNLKAANVMVSTPRESFYRLPGIATAGAWCQLPQAHLWENWAVSRHLLSLTLRHRAELDALKIYLMLLTFRGNGNSVTLLSYDRMTKLSGIDRTEIPRAKSHLFNWGLIVEKEVDPTPELIGRNPTSYKVRGFSADRAAAVATT